MEDKGIIVSTIQGSFASIATTFLVQSISGMIPWLMVMFAIIMTDLFFGVRKSFKMGVEVRFSRAVRATMSKMVTYFAFVCAACMINVASQKNWDIHIYLCLFICMIECSSIIGNIIKPLGIKIDLIGALRVFVKKAADVDDEDVKCILREDKEEKEDGKRE